jgi:hypothetical protein
VEWDADPDEIRTWVLDAVFDPEQGWDVPAEQAALTRTLSSDLNPNYQITVDGIVVSCYEKHRWDESARSSSPAGRLCARVVFTNAVIHRPLGVLADNWAFDGLPGFGVDPEGRLSLHTGIPIARGFPVDLARRQLMVCIGVLADTANNLLRAWAEADRAAPAQPGPGQAGRRPPAPAPTPRKSADWDRARNVASVAGKFLGALIGL